MSMCQENCTWVDEVKLDLMPWDAGTDNGVKYVVGYTMFESHFRTNRYKIAALKQSLET